MQYEYVFNCICINYIQLRKLLSVRISEDVLKIEKDGIVKECCDMVCKPEDICEICGKYIPFQTGTRCCVGYGCAV